MAPESPPQAPHRGWYVHHRLPHFDGRDVAQSITYRLADALPGAAAMPTHPAALRAALENRLDEGHGSCLLRAPDIAALVVRSWHHFDRLHYRLHAWVVMPNHVHLVVTVLAGHPLSRVVRDWKSFSAHAINARRGCGAVWQRGYWDRFIRDADHYDAAVEYVERNPVKAGLVASPEAWPWSSAAARRAGGTPAPPDTRSMKVAASRARRELDRRRTRP